MSASKLKGYENKTMYAMTEHVCVWQMITTVSSFELQGS